MKSLIAVLLLGVSPTMAGSAVVIKPGDVGTVLTANPNGGTATWVALPKCDEGWHPVLDASGHPMCAKELKEPK